MFGAVIAGHASFAVQRAAVAGGVGEEARRLGRGAGAFGVRLGRREEQVDGESSNARRVDDMWVSRDVGSTFPAFFRGMSEAGKQRGHPMTSGPIASLLRQGVGRSGVAQVLRTMRKHLGMDVAFVSRFRETDRVLEHVDADGTSPIQQGQTVPLEDGYCLKIVRGELPALIPDTSAVPAAMALPATRAIPIGAHLSVPIELSNGAIYGTLCCFSRKPDLTLGERDLRLIRALSEVLAARIDEDQEVERLKQRAADEVQQAIAKGAPRIVYQPIYSLASDAMVGAECLSRFDVEPRRTPDVWFDIAHDAGVGLDLELRAIENALGALDRLPAPLWLSLNSSPELILSGRLGPVLGKVDLARIVLEITEHATVPDYAAVFEALAPMRRNGARLAIDDAGAGYASMRHILNLKADIIKLDISLTRGIDTDPNRRALAKGLIAFAREVGSLITAEGVETETELTALRAIGVDKAQGYFLAKPRTLEEIVASAARAAAPIRATG
jgi:EAL domain-containing protein (putative c-di-GMP-specific phosphodiesterase class I)